MAPRIGCVWGHELLVCVLDPPSFLGQLRSLAPAYFILSVQLLAHGAHTQSPSAMHADLKKWLLVAWECDGAAALGRGLRTSRDAQGPVTLTTQALSLLVPSGLSYYPITH